jgi:putative transcriptional regulator
MPKTTKKAPRESANFRRMKASISQALAHSRGENVPGMVVHNFAIKPLDVVAVRKTLEMSQSEFADMLGVALKTLQKWEQGERQPTGAARSLLRVAAREPAAVRRALAAA